MFRNYIKIAYRNLVKYKLTSFINLFGLTIGLTCFMAIIAYSLNELSYDTYHTKSERIYRVVPDWKWEGGNLNMATSSGPMAELLKQNFTEVETTARFFTEGPEHVKSGQNTIELMPIFSESSFFEVFDHQFVYGNPKTALSEPNSMILTESTAIKIFGSVSKAYGKTLEYINRPVQKVTVVIKDVPKNSHLIFDAVGVLDAKADYVNQFHNLSLYTYVVLKEGSDIPALQAKIKKIVAKRLKDYKSDHSLTLQPLTSIHLNSHLPGDFGNGNKQYLYIFWVVGVVILLLACINYINLATAQSTRRAKEVGVRKVMGSGRRELIFQFFSESFLMIISASILSVLLFQLIAPLLSQIGGKPVSLWSLGWQNVILLVLGIVLLVGVISGLYPAVFLSRFNPAAVLKGAFAPKSSHSYFRKSLVVFQFTISIALIAFTFIVWQQLNYVMNKDLGFNKDQVLGLRISNHELRTKNLSALRNKLSNYPGIIGTTATTNPLGDHERIGSNGFFFESNGQKPAQTSISKRLGIDAGYFKMMVIRLIEGRNFSASISLDSTQSMVVNETLAKQHGWTNPIGQRIWYYTDYAGNTKEAKVVGVVKDFHIGSLHKPIEPLLFFIAPAEESDNLYIKIQPEHINESLAFIQKTYREFDNYNPFETYFLDENYANQYRDDNQKRNLFLLFASLAIIIACLGLFGLAAFTIEHRTKEIGIRKVLGASVESVIVLVTRDFIGLVAIAFIIAAPIALWSIHKWLQDFAYRVDIHWWAFALAGMLALFVAILTVSFQALKVALANPVRSLRTE